MNNYRGEPVRMHLRTTYAATCVAIVVLLGACGGDNSASSASSAGTPATGATTATTTAGGSATTAAAGGAATTAAPVKADPSKPPVLVGFHNLEGGAISLPEIRQGFLSGVNYVNEEL